MKKTDQAVCRFGASVMSRYLAALRQEMPGVRQGIDIEAIHRMRVASRRTRSALPLFESCYAPKYRILWRNEIRQVTRALGQARDTDVQIDFLQHFLAGLQESRCRPGINRLILRLRQKRARLQAKVIQALDELEKSQALESMEEQTTQRIIERFPGEPISFSLYNLAKKAISDHLEAFLGFEKYISDPAAVAELHAMRIAAKQLRYTLEIFSPLYLEELKIPIQAVKSAQEMLGDVHDCDTWSVLIPQFLEKERQRIIKFYGHAGFYKMLLPGIDLFQENRRNARNAGYLQYVETWEKWKNDGLWNQLNETIQMPTRLNPRQEFYPSALPAFQVEGNDD
jgi:CHAD domain-containing protein